MTQAAAPAADESILRQEALVWYRKKYPFRQLAEEKIVALYSQIKEYAQGDPLLEEFYRANNVMI